MSRPFAVLLAALAMVLSLAASPAFAAPDAGHADPAAHVGNQAAGHADAHAGERARTDIDGDAIDIRGLDAGLSERRQHSPERRPHPLPRIALSL